MTQSIIESPAIPASPAQPLAARRRRGGAQAGRKDINVIGLSLPNINKP